jgi:cytochrome c
MSWAPLGIGLTPRTRTLHPRQEHQTLTPHPNPLPMRGQGKASPVRFDWSTARAMPFSLSPHGERVRVRGERSGPGRRKVRGECSLSCAARLLAERLIVLICWTFLGLASVAAEIQIQLPPETGAFKQDTGAEIANGQCLICHSVEYVTSQPPMGRAFWKASVVKMQQKYGAPITDSQVEPLADYLTRNYGVSTNRSSVAVSPGSGTPSTDHGAAAHSEPTDGPQLAMKYGCLGCHNPQTKIVGPAYREIAAKYRNDADALSKIDQQIHKGGAGKWGPIIMPPFPQISPGDTKALAEWILGLK